METPTCEIFSVEIYCNWRERDISGVIYPSFAPHNQSCYMQSLMAGNRQVWSNLFGLETVWATFTLRIVGNGDNKFVELLLCLPSHCTVYMQTIISGFFTSNWKIRLCYFWDKLQYPLRKCYWFYVSLSKTTWLKALKNYYSNELLAI